MKRAIDWTETKLGLIFRGRRNRLCPSNLARDCLQDVTMSVSPTNKQARDQSTNLKTPSFPVEGKPMARRDHKILEKDPYKIPQDIPTRIDLPQPSSLRDKNRKDVDILRVSDRMDVENALDVGENGTVAVSLLALSGPASSLPVDDVLSVTTRYALEREEETSFGENIEEESTSFSLPTFVQDDAKLSKDTVGYLLNEDSNFSIPNLLSSSTRFSCVTPEPESNPRINKRFKLVQVNSWMKGFYEAQEFAKRHGHCMIPYDYPPNQILARWAKRQRLEYTKVKLGKPSFLTSERISMLNDIHFIWHNQKRVWIIRYLELCKFKEDYGHSVVPTHYKGNKKLATWVKCQRRQYNLMKEGKKSSMTSERVRLLERVDFKWKIQGSSYQKELDYSITLNETGN